MSLLLAKTTLNVEFATSFQMLTCRPYTIPLTWVRLNPEKIEMFHKYLLSIKRKNTSKTGIHNSCQDCVYLRLFVLNERQQEPVGKAHHSLIKLQLHSLANIFRLGNFRHNDLQR